MRYSEPCSRRQLLRCSAGCVAAGFSERLARLTWAAQNGDAQVLAPKPTHFPAKAKQLLFVFLTGGFSHLDTFDPKPKLREMHGKPFAAFGLRADEAKPLPLLGSPFNFKQCGQAGLWISDLFPHLQTVADE